MPEKRGRSKGGCPCVLLLRACCVVGLEIWSLEEDGVTNQFKNGRTYMLPRPCPAGAKVEQPLWSIW